MSFDKEQFIRKLKDEIDKRVEFIQRYSAIGEAHMVDFLVLDHWNATVDPAAGEDLFKLNEQDLYTLKTVLNCKFRRKNVQGSVPGDRIEDLNEYFEKCQSLRVMNSGICLTGDEMLNNIKKSNNEAVGDVESCPINTKEYMCFKKSHEVDKMSEITKKICEKFNISDVLDLGSGKGYLGAYLSLCYGLNVVGVDSSESNTSGASKRAEKYMKFWKFRMKEKDGRTPSDDEIKRLKKAAPGFCSVAAFVDERFDISSVMGTGVAGCRSKDIMLVGLHTCGDLNSTAIRTFVRNDEVKALCVVGCCYQHLTVEENESENPDLEEHPDPDENLVYENYTASNVNNSGGNPGKSSHDKLGFPMSEFLREKFFSLGRNTRMVALKAPEKREQEDTIEDIENRSIKSLFFRALLTLIIQKEFKIMSKEMRVGKIYAKCDGFVDYVKKCIKKLEFSETQIESLTDEKINFYYSEYESHRKKLVAFNLLREAFAPVVEALILLDRYLYLKQNVDANTDCFLVQLFNPAISPRCYALAAIRH